MKVLHGLFMRNVPGSVSKRLFHAGPEPFLVTGFRFADILFPGSELRFGCAILFMKKVLDKPVQIAGRQLAGVFEDFGGATVHSKIVARNRA